MPAHITPATMSIDRAACAAMICGHCGHLDLEALCYRVVAECPCCGAQEVF